MRLLLILLLCLATTFSSAQTCRYSGLSASFKFKVILTRTFGKDASDEVCKVKVTINIKGKTTPQTISYTAGVLFDDVFRRCDFARSYTTGTNANNEATDNDYGDLIVADFNFDGREDFAVKYSSGGNGGPVYYYYTQNWNGLFERDYFLSNTMRTFPAEMNKAQRTLKTRVHANAYQLGETVYKLNTHTKQWQQASHRFVDYD